MKTMTLTTLANMPRVNLLPPEIREEQKLQQLKLALAVGVALTVAGVAFTYMDGKSSVTSAQAALATQQQKQIVLQAKLKSLQYIPQSAAARDAAEASLTQATATEVHWSGYLADLSVTVPHNMWLTSVAFSTTAQPGSILTPADAPPIIGNVQFAATTIEANQPGVSHNGVADWLDAAAKERGFSDVWFSSSQEAFIGSKRIATFTSTVDLTSDALTKRCAQPGVC